MRRSVGEPHSERPEGKVGADDVVADRPRSMQKASLHARRYARATGRLHRDGLVWNVLKSAPPPHGTAHRTTIGVYIPGVAK